MMNGRAGLPTIKPGLVYQGVESALGSGYCRPLIIRNSNATKLTIMNTRVALRAPAIELDRGKPQTSPSRDRSESPQQKVEDPACRSARGSPQAPLQHVPSRRTLRTRRYTR